MAGETLIIGGTVCHIDYPDGYGEVVVDGRKWSFDFHDYLGPTFLKKNGEVRKCQNPKKAVWAAFEEWFQNYKAEKESKKH
jgi:hypothetical protein